MLLPKGRNEAISPLLEVEGRLEQLDGVTDVRAARFPDRAGVRLEQAHVEGGACQLVAAPLPAPLLAPAVQLRAVNP